MVMKEFKLEIDTNTIYIKILRFLGSVGLGIVLSSVFFSLKHGMEVNWTSQFALFGSSLFFTVFPGIKNRSYLTINELGVFTHPTNKVYWTGQYEFYWDKISSIGLEKNHVRIKQVKKGDERIRLPYYTKEQWNELESYLKEATEFKQIEFKEY